MAERVAVLSDIHSNHLAAEAVIKHARQRDVSRFWCLGDIVGRGPCPIETAMLMQHWYKKSDASDRRGWLAGNHDYLVLEKVRTIFVKPSDGGLADLGGSSVLAATMDRHNRMRLARREALWAWLDTLPSHAEPQPGVFIAHGAFVFDADSGGANENHAHWRYVHGLPQVGEQVQGLRGTYGASYPRVVMNGHTHIARLAVVPPGDQPPRDLPVEHGVRVSFHQLGQETVYVNPGSVGFPRGDDTCPTYAILTLFDDESRLDVEFHTVSYDWRPYFEDAPGTPAPGNASDFPAQFRDQIRRCNCALETEG